jgi:hypothetical protein
MNDHFFQNSYVTHPALSSGEKPFSMYWQAIRLDECDLKSLYTAGKELFARRDLHGIRISPIEALELFKQCYGLRSILLELEADYLYALFYRVINGDNKEFVERLGALMENLKTTQNKKPYARALLTIHNMAKQLSRSFLDDTILNTLSSIAVNQ